MEWLDKLIVFVWLALDAVFIVGALLIACAIWIFWKFYQAIVGAELDDEKASNRRSHT